MNSIDYGMNVAEATDAPRLPPSVVPDSCISKRVKQDTLSC
ncbi:hypothetical protein ACLK19_23070 [Escherichia coli]